MSTSRTATLVAVTCSMLIAIVSTMVLVPKAEAAFGDGFGLAAINDDGGPAQDSPALPGLGHAFWAGTCDIGLAPAPGQPILPAGGPTGGIGTQAASVRAPDGADGFFFQSTVPAPPSPPHCVEWPGPATDLGPSLLWSAPPSWRLPADVQAGGHPDGSTTFAFARMADGTNRIDGAVDNIYVDLPAGFVGDPNAVPKCTSEQFDVKPPLCPPASQVGVMHLELVNAIGGNLTETQMEKIHPVYNLEPRRGFAAELGVTYASGENAIPVRISAKARTSSDFGVTAFVGQIPAALPLRSQEITLWGVPWSAVNDRWRAPIGLTPGELTLGDCLYQPGLQSESFGIGGPPPQFIPPAGWWDPSLPAGQARHEDCAQSYDPSWGPIKPFISNLTECTGGDLSGRLSTDSFQHPGNFVSDGSESAGKRNANNGSPDPADADWKAYESPAPPIAGCEKNPFDPDAEFEPGSTAPDSASGLSVDIEIPQNDDPPAPVATDPGLPANAPGYDPNAGAPGYWRSDAGVATAHLDKTVVTLPTGMSINPSAASGLEACSDAQIGLRQQGNPPLFDNGDPFDHAGAVECPQASIIGTVEATTPLLEEALTGQMVLGTPKAEDIDCAGPGGQINRRPDCPLTARTFLVLRAEERGLIVKVYGSAVADPTTGQLTATFDKNPRAPVENIKVEVRGGERGMLATPPSCGEKTTNSVYTPWTAAHGGGGVAKTVDDSFVVSGNCTPGFGPSLAAGMSNQTARGNGTFSFRFGRQQGEQYLRGLTAKLPQGLLASVKGVPLCTDGQAAAGACPAESKIGIVDAKAGAGNPFVLEEKGEVFLTEGYKGGEYGLMVKVRGVAGPFRGATELSPIVVRQAIHVDRTTAQVSAISDPFPLIHHGVPLRVREVTVLVNRDKFMLNPSDCSAKQVTADLLSDQGATAGASNAFQVSRCAGLAFKPKLGLRLTGKKQMTTGKHPGIRATVTQIGGEAGVGKAVVRLPLSLALDPDNAQALCEFVDGTKPDLENHCPKGSIVGRARAISPLLNDPLVGNVYFVKNIRIDAKTGNQIRTLPMIMVALRGEVNVNLKGESDTQKGKLVNTFDNVPDAPISQFNLNINGGSKGIIAVTRTRRGQINVCKSGKQVAEADFDGQNGKQHDRDIRMGTPCKKKAKKARPACKSAKQKRGKACKRRAAAQRSHRRS